MLTAKERIEEIMGHYRYNPTTLASRLKLPSTQSIYEITNSRTKSISHRLAGIIKDEFPSIRLDWLLTGEGDMLELEEGPFTHDRYAQYDEKGEDVNRAGDDGDDENLTTFLQMFNRYARVSEDRIHNVTDDNMYPTIRKGDMLVLSRWKQKFIAWGRIYLIETTDGFRSINYLYPSKSEGSVICRSENQQAFPDMEIAESDIKYLYILNIQVTIHRL